MFIVANIGNNLIAVTGVSPKILGATGRILGNHSISCRQNSLRGPIVLLQENCARIGIVALKLLNIANTRATECVNGLISIADHTQFAGRNLSAFRTNQLFDQHVLSMVGVLVFIHQNKAESAPIMIGHFRK